MRISCSTSHCEIHVRKSSLELSCFFTRDAGSAVCASDNIEIWGKSNYQNVSGRHCLARLVGFSLVMHVFSVSDLRAGGLLS